MAFAVILRCNEMIAVKEDWIANPVLSKASKIFFSPKQNQVANFDIAPTHFFKKKDVAVYDGFLYRRFGKYLKLKS